MTTPWHVVKLIDEFGIDGVSYGVCAAQEDECFVVGLAEHEAHRIVSTVNALSEERDLCRKALGKLVERVVPFVDHACAECHGSIPEEGFQCIYHLAKALADPQPQEKEKS